MKSTMLGTFALGVVILLIGSPALASPTWEELAKLSASDASAGSQFGRAVSIDGGSLIIGAQYNNQAGSLAGAAYVFEQASPGVWSQAAKLTASDATPNAGFGNAVAVSGNYAVVGAVGDGGYNSKGAAYMFERGPLGWTQVAKLVPPDVLEGTHIGLSVSVSGNYAIAGAAGAAYVFERNTSRIWVQAAKLQASDTTAFGGTVSISDALAIVGDPSHLNAGQPMGAAYVFARDSLGNWTQAAKLTATDCHEGQAFGWDVAVDGSRALVGAKDDDENGNDSGAAYFFEPDATGQWLQKAKLTASDGSSRYSFGVSVALSGDSAVIGANRSVGPSGPTAAYVFELGASGNWEQTAKLTGSPSVYDYFGEAVSMSGNYAVVGAYADNTAGALAGAAYVYTPEPGTISLMALGVLAVLSRRRTAAS